MFGRIVERIVRRKYETLVLRTSDSGFHALLEIIIVLLFKGVDTSFNGVSGNNILEGGQSANFFILRCF